MKNGLSGSIVNEIEVQERWELQREQAILLIKKLKSRVQPKCTKVSHNTFKSEGFDALMERRKDKYVKYKRSDK